MKANSSLSLDAPSRIWSLLAAALCLLPLLMQLPRALALGIGGLGLIVSSIGLLARTLPAWLRLLLAMALIGGVLTASGFNFGRDTGCALLAAMLALKPIEMANVRDARSLIGFGLFAPFAAFLLDQGPLPLVLGLIGATLALAALLRLSELESGDNREPLHAWQRISTVWRLAAIGLPLALATFWLFPRLGTPLWGVPERAMARPGLSDEMAPGEWIDFMTDDSPALRATFYGPTPDVSQMYWRGPVLWNFDGRTWTQSQWFRNLPPARVIPSAARYDYEMVLEPTDRRQVVALDVPTIVPDGLQSSLDYGLFAPRPLAMTTRWRMRSSPPAAFEPDLKVTLRRIALQLPYGYNPRTIELGAQWRREAGPGNDLAIAQRAMRWIRSEFAYTLDTPLLGRNSVDEFLFDHKAGFCEHFSSAFVVLMRAAGIPARVVTGYVGGYRNHFGDYWLVRRSDAHAWAEIWIQGRGWIRMDPTAAVAPERIYDTLDDRATALSGFNPVMDANDWLRRGWNDFVLGFDAARQQQLLQPLGIERLNSNYLLSLFFLVAAFALGWMLWLTTRSERERDPVLRAWHRLDARYRKFGLGREPHESALVWAQRTVKHRNSTNGLDMLTQRFSDWRYGVNVSDQDLVRDLRRHRP